MAKFTGYRVVTNVRLLGVHEGKTVSEEIISVECKEFVHKQNAMRFFDLMEQILQSIFKL